MASWFGRATEGTDGMRNLKDSEKALRELLGERNLSAADFGGAALEGCNEIWCARGPMWCWIFTANITPPERTLSKRTVSEAHRWYWRSTGFRGRPTN